MIKNVFLRTGQKLTGTYLGRVLEKDLLWKKYFPLFKAKKASRNINGSLDMMISLIITVKPNFKPKLRLNDHDPNHDGIYFS